MREPDCVLLRMGESALKSEQVQAKWDRILQENIKFALDAAGVKADIETNPNRVFIYTGQIYEAVKALQKVFGITSMSPAWMTQSKLDSISNLATDVAKEVLLLSNQKSFAIRAHRAGMHGFTSKEVAEVAGAAVKRTTEARVDLGKPEHEIEIEVRSRRSYVMVSRLQGPGGLPLGSGGKAIALIADESDLLSAWLIAKRGVELIVMATAGGTRFAINLKEWHAGKGMEVLPVRDFASAEKLAKEKGIIAITSGEKTATKLKVKDLLVLRPLVGMTGKETAALSAFIKS